MDVPWGGGQPPLAAQPQQPPHNQAVAVVPAVPGPPVQGPHAVQGGPNPGPGLNHNNQHNNNVAAAAAIVAAANPIPQPPAVVAPAAPAVPGPANQPPVAG